MDTKKQATICRTLFYLGLGLGVFVSLDFRYGFLPDYYSGLFAGIAGCLILGGGILGHLGKDRAKNE